MKMYVFALLALLVFEAKCDLEDFPTAYCSEFETNQPAFSLDFCRTTSYDPANERCCYFQYENSNGVTYYHCKVVPITKLGDIDAYIDELEGNSNINEVDKLDCHSSYLYVSLILILALIF